MTRATPGSLCLALILLISCSSKPVQKAKEPPKPVEPVAARAAFQQAFIAARTWAQDLQILQMRNLHVEGTPTAPGKSAAWEVTFASPSKSRARAYTFSAIERENLHEGVFGGLEETWSGPRGQTLPFLIAAFKTDSADAWEAAAGKSAEYMAKNPDKPITYVLEKTPRHPNPTWRVIWGTSAGTSDYSVYVDATTGEFLERMR